MSEDNKNEESDSSELFKDDDKEKNDDIISSSSEEDNIKDPNKILGIKRPHNKDPIPKELKDPRKKIKKSEGGVFFPNFDLPLVTFELFSELQNDKNLNETDLKKYYEEYKTKYELKNNEQFYINHKNDKWFLEKYHPNTFVELNKNERNLMCQKKAEIFFQKFPIENNSPQNLNYNFNLLEEHEYCKSIRLLYTKIKNNQIEEIERDFTKIPVEEEIIQKEINDDGTPYYFYDPDYLTLYNLHYLYKNDNVIEIIKVLKEQLGFISISISEPEKINYYKRNFWVTFDNETNMENAMNSLKDYEIDQFMFKLIKSKTNQTPYNKKIKLTPPLFDNRTSEDIDFSMKIIKILDNDKGIENNNINNIDINNLNDEEQKNLLNYNILYLRKIHGFCYYCLKGYRDERNLIKKCDFLHLRHYKKLGKREEFTEKDDEEIKNAVEFDKCFTQKLNDILNNEENINNFLLMRPKYLCCDENVKNLIAENKKEFIQNNYKQLEEEKYQCLICEKKFKAFNYIENHMNNKHMEKIDEYIEKNLYEKLMRDNFFNDKEKFNKSNIINSKEEYEESLNKLNNRKNGMNDHTFHKKYKDWDDPINFQNPSSDYIKVSYDDL